MIPVLFRIPEWIPWIGAQPVTSFGVLLLVAFLAAGKLFVDGLRTAAPEARGWDLVVTAAVAGLVGAKLLHLGLNGLLGLPTGLGRAGLDWFGGLAVGAGAVLWQARRQGLDLQRVAGAAAAPLALGYAVGRIGSFLVGSEYGLPTALPWGIAFPSGHPPTTPANLIGVFGAGVPPDAVQGDFVRVHPTQLYEVALAVGILVAVRRAWHARAGACAGGARVLGLFLALHGTARALVELLRAKTDRIAGPVTVDLLLAAAVVGVGVWLQAAHGSPHPRRGHR